jgi:hypothetical protein
VPKVIVPITLVLIRSFLRRMGARFFGRSAAAAIAPPAAAPASVRQVEASEERTWSSAS